MKLIIALIAALLLAPPVSLNAAPPEAGSPAVAHASGDAEVGSAAPNSGRKKQKVAAYLETGGERKLDVTYKRVGPRDLQLDLYYPTANRAGKSPVVIYTHGGGWAAGSRQGAAKHLFASLFTQLLAKGFCVVPVDYRLWNQGGTVAMRDCVIDSKDAVRYLAKHSESLGLDSERFYVMGDSAGGQIAMMLLLTPPDSLLGDPQLADASYRIFAGVSWYGPCDFENQNLFNHDNRADFADRFGPRIAISDVSPAEKLALYREMSPIRYLAKDSPRLLMIQGDKDTTIPVKHAYYMKEKAAAVHAPVEIMIVKNAGHNWREVGAPIEPAVDEIVQRTARFFSEQPNPTKSSSHSGNLRAPDVLPPFSWDHVPVYAHVGKTSDDFTPEQLDFLAKHFNFIAFEKSQAVRKRGSTEAGIAEAARQIKLRKPDVKVLFYWNAFLDIHSYQASREFPVGGHLTDRGGRPVMVRTTVPTYDLSRADVREWWSDTAAKAVREGECDGIFADALLAASAPGRSKPLGDEKYAALNDGLLAMLAEARRKLGPDKLLIFNGLRGTDGSQFLPLSNGAMIEHFGHFSGMGKEKMAEDLHVMSSAARAGKIVCLKAWPGFSWLDEDMMTKSHDELARLARERLTFSLACFLVAAEPHCYFCYTWGYSEDHGTFDWYPEFDKPLGPPLGEAKRSGWTYQRDFAHAAVSVDLETQTARIDWKP